MGDCRVLPASSLRSGQCCKKTKVRYPIAVVSLLGTPAVVVMGGSDLDTEFARSLERRPTPVLRIDLVASRLVSGPAPGPVAFVLLSVRLYVALRLAV